MKTDYILKHVGPNLSYIVCVIPTKKMAEKAMDLYAEFVEWNWNTKRIYQDSYQVQFENESSIYLVEEQRIASIKDFKRMINYNWK